MTPYPLLIALFAVLIVYTVIEYKTRSPWPRLAVKTVSSLLFVSIAATSALAPGGMPAAYGVFMAAFAFSLAGDVLLSWPMKNSLPLGLGAFLLSQCIFTVAFSLRWGLSFIDAAALAILAGGALMTLWNARGMEYGNMEKPVMVYAVAVSAMAAKAVSGAYLNGGTGAWLAAVGGMMFFSSDVVLSFSIFNQKKPPCLRGINLGLYFVGQALIAWSLWF